jgi:hypothetical protein
MAEIDFVLRRRRGGIPTIPAFFSNGWVRNHIKTVVPLD